MELNSRYTVFDQNIVCDIFGDEVVLVNLETGVYYSFMNSAAQVWTRIQNQYTIAEIVSDFELLYSNSSEDIIPAVKSFVDNLLLLKLIKTSTLTERILINVKSDLTKTAFAEPLIETFSDLQDILLLDPVHDVDQKGWPIRKDNDSKETKS
jgi:hypothetical protein